MIIGNANRFRSNLTERLMREGNRVYILSPKKGDREEKAKVYCHPYIHPSNREVYFSCRPDIAVFMGAYDPHYDWSARNASRLAQEFAADLNNLLLQANEAGVRQFIYLSSEEVFDQRSLSPVPEESTANASTPKGSALALGESLVAHYGTHTLMDCITLRMDDVYYEVDTPSQCSSTFTRMVREALTSGQIAVDAKLTHSALHVNDAVQAIVQLISASSHQRQLYHITSTEDFNEDALAELISANAVQPVHFVDNTVGVSRVQMLYGAAFQQEFHFEARCSLGEFAPAVIQYILHNSNRFHQSQMEEKQRRASRYHTFLHKLYPFAESTAVFFPAMFLQSLAMENALLEKVDFFILYVFVFSLIHGFSQSVYTCVLSAVGYLILHSSSGSSIPLALSGSSYLWMAQLFILGMAVGSLKDRVNQTNEKWEEETAYLKDQLEDITTINESNVELKDYFEQRDINNRQNLNYFYTIIRRLEDAPEDEMMFISVQVLEDAMGTHDAAIYSIAGNGFCRLKTATSNRAMSLGKSIRISEQEALFTELEAGRIFVNRALSKQLPSMAVAMKDESGNLQYMILLWDMPYEQMTQHSINTLRLLSLIIYNYINKTIRYLAAISRDRYYEGTRILHEDVFRSLFSTYSKASGMGLSSVSLLLMENAPQDVEKAQEMLGKLFRQDDILGQIGNRYYVLLPNTDRSEAALVINRLAQKGVIASYLLEPPPLLNEKIVPFTAPQMPEADEVPSPDAAEDAAQKERSKRKAQHAKLSKWNIRG